jgi:hypothetical protein
MRATKPRKLPNNYYIAAFRIIPRMTGKSHKYTF